MRKYKKLFVLMLALPLVLLAFGCPEIEKEGNFIPDTDYVPLILEPGDPDFAARTDLYRFYDDFSTGDAANNNMLDSTKWGYDLAGGGFGSTPRAYYQSDNIRIVDCDEIPGNRKAVITMKKQSIANRDFTSGKFWTRDKFASTYGKIEAKIRICNKLIEGGYAENPTNLQSLFPSFWMMPADSVYGGWPRSGEIDIMNIMGSLPSRMFSNIHRRAESATQNGQTWITLTSSRSPTGGGLLASYDGDDYIYADIINGIPGGSDAGDWHVYCLEWDYDGERIEFRFYIDDVLTYTIKESQWDAYSNSGGFNGELPKPKPFDQDFYLIFDLSFVNSPPSTSAAIFQDDAPPVEYEIDWVVWREIMPRDGEPGGIQKPIYPEQ